MLRQFCLRFLLLHVLYFKALSLQSPSMPDEGKISENRQLKQKLRLAAHQ